MLRGLHGDSAISASKLLFTQVLKRIAPVDEALPPAGAPAASGHWLLSRFASELLAKLQPRSLFLQRDHPPQEIPGLAALY